MDSEPLGSEGTPPTPRAVGREGTRLRFWGTRGSIPSPGPETTQYGGNTACLEVQAGVHRYVLDAGSGARSLGSEIIASETPARTTFLLSHFHWDHIQGLPFFQPLFDPAAELTIIGPKQGDIPIRDLLEGQMNPMYFPVPLSAMRARATFEHLNEGSWSDGVVRVTAMRVRHGSYTVGYRLELDGIRLCYVPDNELGGYDFGLDAGWRERFTQFISGSDILVHDAMYTAEEFENRVGWGHSSFDQCLDVALDAGVKRLLFFHHDPERTDDDLAREVERARNRAARAGTLDVDAAREGAVLIV